MLQTIVLILCCIFIPLFVIGGGVFAVKENDALLPWPFAFLGGACFGALALAGVVVIAGLIIVPFIALFQKIF